MKHFSEISLIATVSFIGELLHYLIPLPVPSSIYGLLLMLLLLVTHISELPKELIFFHFHASTSSQLYSLCSIIH